MNSLKIAPRALSAPPASTQFLPTCRPTCRVCGSHPSLGETLRQNRVETRAPSSDRLQRRLLNVPKSTLSFKGMRAVTRAAAEDCVLHAQEFHVFLPLPSPFNEGQGPGSGEGQHVERLAVSGRLPGPGSPHLAPATNVDGAAATQPFLQAPPSLVSRFF